ncbi:MAG: sulfatase-like hydrolase/transferase [Candidatus Aminicenantes bacterium]|nr:sulfatase-like hydrolase/transferase [Candidatus Aminicenantes bacterium]
MREKINYLMAKLLFSIALFGSASFLRLLAIPDSPKANLLLVSIDTIRPDRISCYETRYLRTPNIERLAIRGLIFDRAFAHTPLTLPSHVNMLTGLTPPFHGVHDNARFRLKDDILTLAEYLKIQGYTTGAFIGAFPLDSRFGLNQGFDVYDDHYSTKARQEFFYIERPAESVINASLDWLKNQRNPWFAFIHLWDPHQPYNPPEPFKSQFSQDLYSGEVAYVDNQIGRLISYLEEQRLLEQTIIIITGDHGESLGEHGESTHGYFAYNSTLWVPLIIIGPSIKPGRISDYVFHIDLFPTISELINGSKLKNCQGISLLPLIKGKKLPKRQVYFESLYAYYNRGWAPLKGFFEPPFKFLDCPLPEFYDLKNDFNEKNNLVAQIKLNEYRRQLEQLEKKLTNPLKKERPLIEPETLEKLRSLGYVAQPAAVAKKSFGPEDDLKTLLPLQEKFTRAMGGYHRGQVQEAITALREIIAERKNFDLAYSYLSTIYKREGRIGEAIKILRQGLANNPQSYSIISSFGILLAEAGLHDEAISVLQIGVSLWDYDPEMWNYLGMAYWGKGDYDNALKAYERALDLDPNYPIVFNNLGSLYLARFLKNNNIEDINRAIDYFQKALSLDAELVSAYNGLGGAYKKIGQIKEALDCWQKAIELNPNYDFALYNLGLTYYELGDKKTALKYLERYLIVKKNLSTTEKEKIMLLIKDCRQ